MGEALVPHPDFHTAKIQPGDVIIVTDETVQSMSPVGWARAHQALWEAAKRSGLTVLSTYDLKTKSSRLEFTAPKEAGSCRD